MPLRSLVSAFGRRKRIAVRGFQEDPVCVRRAGSMRDAMPKEASRSPYGQCLVPLRSSTHPPCCAERSPRNHRSMRGANGSESQAFAGSSHHSSVRANEARATEATIRVYRPASRSRVPYPKSRELGLRRSFPSVPRLANVSADNGGPTHGHAKPWPRHTRRHRTQEKDNRPHFVCRSAGRTFLRWPPPRKGSGS
jgi:hypothetical protein